MAYKIKAKVGEGDSATEMEVPVAAAKVEHPLVLRVDGNPYSYDGSEDLGEITITSGGSGDTGKYDSILDNNSWALISEAEVNNIAAALWSDGDVKSVYLKGTIGTLSIDTTLYAYIIGINHNYVYEGQRIHFQGFKDADGKDVCLIDSGYNSYYTNGTKYFNVSHWDYYNYGGWSACDFRYDILGSTDVEPTGYGARRYEGDVGYDPTSSCTKDPVPGTLMDCLPLELRQYMKPIAKYSDNIGGATSDTSNVTATTDYLPLLSIYEVRGALGNYENTGEALYQKQYDYYINGNSMIKYRWQDGTTGSAAYWWTRSVYTASGAIWYCVSASGGASYSYAYLSDGLSAAFAI